MKDSETPHHLNIDGESGAYLAGSNIKVEPAVWSWFGVDLELIVTRGLECIEGIDAEWWTIDISTQHIGLSAFSCLDHLHAAVDVV